MVIRFEYLTLLKRNQLMARHIARKSRFTLRTLLLSVCLISIALGGTRYFFFPPPMKIQILPAAALKVPEDGAFSVNGEIIPTNSLGQCLEDYADTTLGRCRRGRIIVALPPNCMPGTCGDALYEISERGVDAGFDSFRAVGSDLDD